MSERLFIGTYPEGILYADRHRKVAGDYAHVAFLSYRTLELTWYQEAKHLPGNVRKQVEGHAASLQARRGEQYQVSTFGQTVTLGKP